MIQLLIGLDFHDNNAAMAAGNTFATEGYISELQPSTKLHKPSLEPKPTRTKEKKPNPKDEQKNSVLPSRQLEETLGPLFMDHDHGWPIHVEVLSVQADERVPGHGLLRPHR